MIIVLARKTLRYLLPYRFLFLVAIAQVILLNALELLKPWPLKLIIDNVQVGGQPLPWEFLKGLSREQLLLAICIGLVLIYLLWGGLSLLHNYTTISIGQRMVNDLRGDLYSHLQRLSLAFHNRQQVGDLLYRIATDTYAIQSLTMNTVIPILSAVVFLVGMFTIMVQLDPLLTFLALSVCPALFITLSLLNRPINKAATQSHQQESVVYSLVQRNISAMRIIQAFTKEDEEHSKFMAASRESLAARLRLYNLQSLYSGVVSLVSAVGTALVVWVAANQVLAGELTVGELVLFTSYLASLYDPINSISQTYGMTQWAQVGVMRVFEILDIERDLPEGTKTFPTVGAKGEIVWDNVSFDYLPDQPTLKQINLRVRAGQKVAIVGPTGAGKSTLVSLLPRFYDPQVGRVTIDGVDVREFQLKSLRRQIGMVLQPPIVFPLSFRENIAYGRPDAALSEVVTAARLARIHDLIVSTSQGYDTVVGERGATLSEGERQRLTIARAILLDAPILILDEPTSSVDAETEALIMEGLDRLTVGRTTLIIAHRLSTVRQADSIVVLRAGQIVEQGTFAELMSQRSAFAALYRTQFSLQGEK
ncbi:MAG: putative multidrug export ATP-binding/permease protein [Chroococcidiopsis cubana SAG 39.79]|jgi:ATP-binding cassette, subfamily B, bacterial|uniref:ABC transporter related protein n=3 Tax=Chroococcidiopsis TaxID=54298 RepID=K9U0A0_CHRTP|nr:MULTISPECIES: ABC transporter ATP-binding protein [Chroococcidiopsis]PSB42398.1 ABC transporter ATP-binding protein [Cyanosarcina cf. burmensis CCALA 770]AFY87841.1 ABC transporter related protein [Chroococcidiopsis thermalis PCC 7203]MDZ4875388.1 putative multidrug export ATP-binding/permease protein [Chroococcidiopsis cubana SAG 39.79]RUT02268.1 protein-tyrosine-phosphatase [Chroococcidiopsis cubana SAG 39.79]URD52756.1 ABC transporter ATP-binding protein/permease [Chroococcidiopsis sp. C